MRKLTNDQALEFGVQPVHHQMNNGELRFRLTRHNVYLFEGTVLHTIKYGCSDSDWEAVPALDDKLRRETFDGKTFFIG